MGMKSKIGIALDIVPKVSSTDNPEDVETAERANATSQMWFYDAIIKGKYPETALMFYKEKFAEPKVLDGEDLADTIAAVQDGTVPWDQAIPNVFSNTDTGAIEGETPVIGKKALDEMVTGLRIQRIRQKFPFYYLLT